MKITITLEDKDAREIAAAALSHIYHLRELAKEPRRSGPSADQLRAEADRLYPVVLRLYSAGVTDLDAFEREVLKR